MFENMVLPKAPWVLRRVSAAVFKLQSVILTVFAQ